MNDQQLKEQALEFQRDNNPETLRYFMRELKWMRNGRLRRGKQETFTCEQIIKDAQRRIYLQAPTSLYGAIGRIARQEKIIEETGEWVAAERDARHANRVPLCRWMKA